MGIQTNNIIIGTNITLADGTTDSINIGGILFGTGSYNTITGDPYSGSVGGGKIGVNITNPSYSLDVSGSGNYTDGLTVTGSLLANTITGSLFGTASYALEALSASFTQTASYVLNAVSASFAATSSYVNPLNQNVQITGSLAANSITSSLQVTGNSSYSGSQTFTTGYILLAQVSQSLNYEDDTAAAANGVPLGGLYRNGNFIAIRIL